MSQSTTLPPSDLPALPDLAALRQDYTRAQLDEADAPAAPLAQFTLWLQQALHAQVPEPTAMTLATVGGNLRPATRIVLLKGCDANGLCWYTHYNSRKGQELAGNPWAALQFHWVELERVVRVEGRAEVLDDAQNNAYFASRPPPSRLGAWASAQSRVIAGRGVLEEAEAAYRARFGDTIPRPPHWGGYRLRPDYWEFWQGRASRLHDRLCYRLQDDGNWLRERLAP